MSIIIIKLSARAIINFYSLPSGTTIERNCGRKFMYIGGKRWTSNERSFFTRSLIGPGEQLKIYVCSFYHNWTIYAEKKMASMSMRKFRELLPCLQRYGVFNGFSRKVLETENGLGKSWWWTLSGLTRIRCTRFLKKNEKVLNFSGVQNSNLILR